MLFRTTVLDIVYVFGFLASESSELKISDIVPLCNRSLNVADDITGVTPLHVAVETENIACIKEMIICGASLDAADRNGLTVFHYAARTSNEMIVQVGQTNSAGKVISMLDIRC